MFSNKLVGSINQNKKRLHLVAIFMFLISIFSICLLFNVKGELNLLSIMIFHTVSLLAGFIFVFMEISLFKLKQLNNAIILNKKSKMNSSKYRHSSLYERIY